MSLFDNTLHQTTTASDDATDSFNDDLPSPSTTTASSSSSSEDPSSQSLSDAEREWRESMQQLELLLTMVLIPYLGKYFGRKAAYWGWARYMEWMHPGAEVVVTDRKMFEGAGMVEAALGEGTAEVVKGAGL
ncbi:MAG: hypothetical protein M1831_005589 [Alyxoria varia]|nr:MAG: hypothetical protein M1831_005589 [Alyxoria varia]